MARLLPEEVAHYRQQGRVVPRFALPAPQVAAMVQTLDELIQLNPSVRPEKLVSAHVTRDSGDNGEGVRGVAQFLELACDPHIVAVVANAISGGRICESDYQACMPAYRPQPSRLEGGDCRKHLQRRISVTMAAPIRP